jgi:hypothetical protein
MNFGLGGEKRVGAKAKASECAGNLGFLAFRERPESEDVRGGAILELQEVALVSVSVL